MDPSALMDKQRYLDVHRIAQARVPDDGLAPRRHLYADGEVPDFRAFDRQASGQIISGDPRETAPGRAEESKIPQGDVLRVGKSDPLLGHVPDREPIDDAEFAMRRVDFVV